MNNQGLLSMMRTLQKNRSDNSVGIFSICSANQFVIEASMKEALSRDAFVLIESTCNQVNQYGGYTGMTASRFRVYIESIAKRIGFSKERIILGGDHLGPYPWRNLPAESAIVNSEELARDYAKAGFRKIHLDASMLCKDDSHKNPLDLEISANRAVRMCKVIEREYTGKGEDQKPVYVIGTEVPVPGGQLDIEEDIHITHVNDVAETIATHREAFIKANLQAAWDRVIAVVVQPGVEFNEHGVIDYDSSKTKQLKLFIESLPSIVYEAHSTDYQNIKNLKEMVANHFAILKVGPALTFALREALIGFAHIEEFLVAANKVDKPSELIRTLRRVMDQNPKEWQDYLPRNSDLEIAKIFSYSDRIRYYWSNEDVKNSLAVLMNNICQTSIPLTLIKQYFPVQYERVRAGNIMESPINIIHDHIVAEIVKYSQACNP